MIEVKPYKQCIPPSTPKKPTDKSKKTYYNYQKSMQRYKKEVQTYSQNQAKWSAAGAWCRKHHFNWIVANEKNVPEFIR